MKRQIILDTETTGLSPGHRILEMGCLEMVNRRLTGERYHQYVNPEREIERGAAAIHGITQEFLADKPVFADIVESFLAFVRGGELIIHNAPFDVGFINYELTLLEKPYDAIDTVCQIFDTLSLARRLYPGQKNSLDALCRRLNVDNSNRDLHGALLDSELLSQVYLLMTGGQTQLFQSESLLSSAEAEGGTKNISRLAGDRLPLAVITATTKELLAHNDFIKKNYDEK